MATAVKKYECDKCHGSGIVDVYRRVDNGFCYKCNGSGKLGHMPMSQRPNGGCKHKTTTRYMRDDDSRKMVTIVTKCTDKCGSEISVEDKEPFGLRWMKTAEGRWVQE